MSDIEPRRSVRATKGQHKALEQLDQPIEVPKKRSGGSKKGKKAAAEREEPEEEIIRCACGAAEQDEDANEPWIACDECGAWQHNICMGLSEYDEDLPKLYYCELCKPENHKELLAGIAKGEKPWETRRRAHEDQKNEEKNQKKRGNKKGKKRAGDAKDEEASQTPKHSSPPPSSSEPKKDVKAAGQKRKTVDAPQEKEHKKSRKVTETHSVPVSVSASTQPSPQDVRAKVANLPLNRQNVVKGLAKSLTHSLDVAEKQGSIASSDGVSIEDRAQRYALQIEQAVNDAHPNTTYGTQIRTLIHNLKTNVELAIRLHERTLTASMLAAMSTEELASKELQKETAEMRARAEKQAIKITEDVPRVRRTHKGDEIIGDDSFALAGEDVPSGPVRRPSAKSDQRRSSELTDNRARSASRSMAVDTQQSPSRSDFDLNKVFSTVKSPTVAQNQGLPTATQAAASGPGVDPEVDRLLEDGSQSPPYSPKDDNEEVWRGNLVMNTIATFGVIGRHVGGANPADLGVSWDALFPKNLTVCGRIDEQSANVYLCSMRYSAQSEIIVSSVEAHNEAAREGMDRLMDYFVSKKRYGVLDRKGMANVRDTYLVPVLPGTGGHPEFMLNLEDNFIPQTRTQPIMLVVFVYRREADDSKKSHSGSTTPTSPGFPPVTRHHTTAPNYSPTVPPGYYPNFPSNMKPPAHQSQPPQPRAPPPPEPPLTPQQIEQKEKQRLAERVARDVLGYLVTSPTVQFLLPQAANMARREWELIKRIYEQDPKARDDLPYLASLLEKEGAKQSENKAPSSAAPPQQQHQNPPVQRPQQQPPLPPQQAQYHVPQASPQQQLPTPPVTVQPRQTLAQQPQPPQQFQHLQQPQSVYHHAPPIRQSAIPPPPIPQGALPPSLPTQVAAHANSGPAKQTPIPPPPIPPQASGTPAAAPTTGGGSVGPSG
ncbi:SPOC domain-containing protein [Podospora fimiseda]|uniref:Transcription factor BYE1 n=1 Tax=Podospora fimiseda TaxID=252190 RepID=A0AAN7BSM3_9PEZI|nr:SPOC domain-containing protein [Podospora fimiseda]